MVKYSLISFERTHHLGIKNAESLLDELGNVYPAVIRKRVADKLAQLVLVNLGADSVNFEGGADAAVQHELYINQGERVELIKVEQIEQD